jgi:3-oxoacyl-[acyl-carrier protein] reductase
MSRKLEGKVAVVTGASKGIGASIALHLAAEGAAVVVNYSSGEAGANRIVGEIVGSGGRAIAVRANLANEPDVRRLFDESVKAFGPIDILVNNAGVYEFKPLEEVTVDHYRKIFDVNVLGLLLASREALKYFRPRSENGVGGNIINVSSVAATAAPPNSSVYSATKGAVDTITLALANELGPRGIRVNAINPGMVITEGVRTAGIEGGDFQKEFEAKTPLGRVGQPHDVAPAAVFLASNDSSWITGQTLHIAGGFR